MSFWSYYWYIILLRIVFFFFSLFIINLTCCQWQAALDKGKNLEKNEPSAEDSCQETEAVKSVVSQMNDLAVSVNSAVVTPPSNSTQCSTPDPIPDIDKKIRALKKKVKFLMILGFNWMFMTLFCSIFYLVWEIVSIY